jgi:hypothetical protein
VQRKVATVASHNGLGVFLVPTTSGGSVVIRKEGHAEVGVDWLKNLQQYELMRFTLPAEGFEPRVEGGVVACSVRTVWRERRVQVGTAPRGVV